MLYYYLRDCTRYAMKREVAANTSVFPWSMSDFKPGDRDYSLNFGIGTAVLCRVRNSSLPECPGNPCGFPVFKCEYVETPGRVYSE